MFFHTRFKTFQFFRSGFNINIKEILRGRVFTLQLNLEEGRWIADHTAGALNSRGHSFWKTMHTATGCITMEKQQNEASSFLRISKLENGRMKALVVPGERGEEGWRNFYREMNGYLSFRSADNNRGGRNKSFLREEQEGREETGESPHNTADERGRQRSKDVKWAVGVVRETIFISWNKIGSRISTLLNREVKIHPLSADRAIVWCKNSEEKQRVLRMEPLFGREGEVKTSEWSKEFHWENVKIKAKGSWIGIEGLPLNLWNAHVFKVLGRICGGLLEIAKETRNMEFLHFAKIKVKGWEDGFLNPTLVVPHDGGTLVLGITSLDDGQGVKRVFRTRGIKARMASKVLATSKEPESTGKN